MNTVIVFGGYGLLGSSLVPMLRSMGYRVFAQGRSSGADLSLDPTDITAVSKVLVEHQPAVVVNLIAATNVDDCETNLANAWLANAGVTGVIVQALKDVRAKEQLQPHLIQISTDQVYDGPGPHEEKNVRPINSYGLSKYTAELLAGTVESTVLRSNFYGLSRCPTRVSFSDWLVSNLRELKKITVFDDVNFSGIHIETLCSIIERCIEYQPLGVFNVGCSDSMSKAAFSLALAKKLNLPSKNIKIGSLSELGLKARRPLDMSLRVEKIEAALGIKSPTMLEEIERTAKDYFYG